LQLSSIFPALKFLQENKWLRTSGLWRCQTFCGHGLQKICSA